MGVAERRERERQARRQAVLDAMRALVRERGFNGTTTRRIAERAELSEATLFWYFRSKDEIFTSLLFEAIEFMSRGLEEIEARPGPPAERLEALWGFFSRVRAEHPEYFQVFAHLAQPQATAAVDEEVRAEIARRSGDNFRLFARVLGGAAGSGRARVGADLLWAAFFGLMVLRDSRANLGATAHPDARDLGEALEMLLGGIPPAGGGALPARPARSRQSSVPGRRRSG
ncbi:MAG: helix-turn-helix transcriptional regulator [Acidobacteria bacterium]|nr:helix-turn-helix transcriptional regulator [Acidobacteriota bacterium]